MSNSTNAVRAEHPEPEGQEYTLLEQCLLKEARVTPEQIERARRIASRMREPKPITQILVELGQLARSDQERVLKVYKSQLDVAGILREEGALDETAFASYRKTRTDAPDRTERDILVDGGLVAEEQFLRALCTKHDIPYLAPEPALVDEKLLARVSIPYLLKHKVLPYRMADGVLTLIMPNPLDNALLREMAGIYKSRVRPCGGTTKSIEDVLQHSLNRSKGVKASEEETATIKYREIRDVEEGEEIGAEAVRIVDNVFFRAIQAGASDIHIEPQNNQVRVRIRVDGALHTLSQVPSEFAPRITARIKVLCNADLAERRQHQDGRIFVRAQGKDVDMRVSTYVSMYGETVVIRLLDRERGLVPLEGLGFEPAIMRTVGELVLRAPTGLVLVTGPTGSGKTTTLYSFVDTILEEDIKIITCEDPVEYVLEGVTQCSVNQETGPTFSDSLRAMLRQDPDIIVVGEIRDKITASLAVEAALTGHKVLSTFHTEDAVSAIVRLLDMGVEPFLVSSTLDCVVAQRLVRRLCPHCRRPGSPSAKDLRYLGLSRRDLDDIRVSEPGGCEKCGNLGYKGRAGIHEVLLLNDDFRDAILNHAPAKELRALAKQLPAFLSLQEDGLLKVASGVTTLPEVVDNAPRDPGARRLSVLREMSTRRTAS